MLQTRYDANRKFYIGDRVETTTTLISGTAQTPLHVGCAVEVVYSIYGRMEFKEISTDTITKNIFGFLARDIEPIVIQSQRWTDSYDIDQGATVSVTEFVGKSSIVPLIYCDDTMPSDVITDDSVNIYLALDTDAITGVTLKKGQVVATMDNLSANSKLFALDKENFRLRKLSGENPDGNIYIEFKQNSFFN